MKNAMKKISAIAMAFTLLGSGTAIINNAAPKFDNSITASAASPNYTCAYWNYTAPNSNACYNNGSSGSRVKWIQAALNYAMYWGTWLDVDGKYGNLTKQRVKDFQCMVNDYMGYHVLDVDGIYGPQTNSWLRSWVGA